MDASQISNYKRFGENTISEIRSEHFLEHTENPEEIMKEWHRILSTGGILKIKLPHFSRGFTNPDHKKGFHISLPLHFNKEILIFDKYNNKLFCFSFTLLLQQNLVFLGWRIRRNGNMV